MKENLHPPFEESELEQVLFDAVPELGCVPRSLCELFTSEEIAVLWRYLNNGNDPLDVAMNFRTESGETIYRKSATKTYDQLISWSIATIQGKKPGKEISLIPYATNQDVCSRWAVMDFDAHHGEIMRAYTLARDAYRHFQKRTIAGVVVFLEHTGAGGWHLWLISLEIRPCSWWSLLLKEAAVAIAAPIEAGICEIFPYE